MTVTIKHAFTVSKADGPDATLVQPSNWNEDHTVTQAPSRILGRTSAGVGPTEEITISSGLVLASGELSLSAELLSFSNITRATGFDTFMNIPSSANFLALLTTKTGTGLSVFGTSPTLSSPVINGTVTGNFFGSAATADIQAGSDFSVGLGDLATRGDITDFVADVIDAIPGATPPNYATGNAALPADGIGTYALLSTTNSTPYVFGATLAGSNLFPVGFNDSWPSEEGRSFTSTSSGGPVSGTWRCMGYHPSRTATDSGTFRQSSLWLRIA